MTPSEEILKRILILPNESSDKDAYHAAMAAIHKLEASLQRSGREDMATLVWKIRDGLCRTIGPHI